MAAGTTISPLTNSQKVFLQRLLVSHVLSDENSKHLYASIKRGFEDVAPTQAEEEEDDGDDQGYMGDNLEHCLCIINASLVPAFNLEVCTVSLPPAYDPNEEKNNDNDNDDGEGEQDGSSRRKKKKRPQLVKYHAVVNRGNDDVAKSHAFPTSRGGPHVMAYIRLVLEKLVERGVELSDDGVGCPGKLNKMNLINLRTELEGAHKDKLTIRQTEVALELMEGEGWLVRVAPPDDDDDDDDMGNDSDEEEGGRGTKKRKKRKSKSKRKSSLKGTFYGVGPRSFMELGEFLQHVGLPEDRMPQSILHRI